MNLIKMSGKGGYKYKANTDQISLHGVDPTLAMPLVITIAFQQQALKQRNFADYHTVEKKDSIIILANTEPNNKLIGSMIMQH